MGSHSPHCRATWVEQDCHVTACSPDEMDEFDEGMVFMHMTREDSMANKTIYVTTFLISAQ